MAATTCVIQAVLLERIRACVQPVLEGKAGHVWRELRDEELAEVLVVTFTEEFPNVAVRKCGHSSNLELKEMVLSRA